MGAEPGQDFAAALSDIQELQQALLAESATLLAKARAHRRELATEIAQARASLARSWSQLERLEEGHLQMRAVLIGGEAPSKQPDAGIAAPSVATGAVRGRHFKAVQDLIRQVETTLQSGDDPINLLAQTVRSVILCGTDPYVMSGVLLEGIVYNLTEQLDTQEYNGALRALIMILHNRLRSTGSAGT